MSWKHTGSQSNSWRTNRKAQTLGNLHAWKKLGYVSETLALRT